VTSQNSPQLLVSKKCDLADSKGSDLTSIEWLCASPRERSFSTNPCSPSSVPHRSRVTPVSWSCRFVAGSGRAGHYGTGSAFVPQIALLIAAATADRSVLAIGRKLEVIPVTLGVSSWKVSRQRLRPASCGSLRISRRRGKDIVGS